MSGSGDPGSASAGAGGGSAQIIRLRNAIKRDPEAWIRYYDDYLRRECGAEVCGLGYSAAEYGRRRINFANCKKDFEWFWAILAEAHAIGSTQSHAALLAFIIQALKATEQSVLDGGDWGLGWVWTGLPDPRPGKNRRSAAHPVEYAAGISYLKEMKAIEEWRESRKKDKTGE